MKTFYIYLCFIFVSGLAGATTKTSTSIDKPDYIYVESYNESDDGSSFEIDTYYDFNGNQTGWYTDDGTDSHTVNWTDGAGGTAHKTLQVTTENNNGSTTYPWECDSTTDTVWPVSSYPDPVPAGTNTMTGCGSNDYDLLAGSPIVKEHCDIGIPEVDNSGAYTYPYDGNEGYSWKQNIVQFRTRHAQAKMTLKTGGRSGSKRQNLFGFNGSASQIVCTKLPPPFNAPASSTPPPIPQQNITLGSVGRLPATGTKYKVLPDDATIDVTPKVDGVDYFTFDVSRSKYHSYFDVYVNQPYPGTRTTYSDYTGHAFWQFETDAPDDALQYLSASLTDFLNTSWGFYPKLADCGFAGQLKNDDTHPYQVQKVFFIGFDDLISGLQFTRGIYNAPPEYCVAIFGYSCVGAATSAGKTVGITLPSGLSDVFPQNFGADILKQFPGPLIDDTPR